MPFNPAVHSRLAQCPWRESNPLTMNRRDFLVRTVGLAGLAQIAGQAAATATANKPLFEISLAEWSYHKALFAGKFTNLDFPVVARRKHSIAGIELVNQFFMDKVKDQDYLRDLKQRADDEGVKILLIMCDGVGALGDPDAAKRRAAVEGHRAWAEAAKFLGGHSIRVNASTGNQGSFEEQQQRAADGLSALADVCGSLGLNCIVENHGGLSSHGEWLAGVMRKVNKPNCGTLPDFGNFNLGDGKEYDRYQGVKELMPFAKAVSAKSHDFDADGNETHTDYHRMMKIVLDAGYRGWVGVEYEGSKLGEAEGIDATRDLLLKVREKLA